MCELGFTYQDSFLNLRYAHLGNLRSRDALLWSCFGRNIGDEESDGNGNADRD